MSDLTLTREEVDKALKWRHLMFIISPDSLEDCDMYHDPDDVERHVETLTALCRMQGEAIRQMRAEFQIFIDARPGTWDDPTDFTPWAKNRSQFAIDRLADPTLALLPTEGETNAEE